jgi:hypothetical protein
MFIGFVVLAKGQGISDYGDQWALEFVAGTTSFQGDLVQGNGPYKRLAPSLGVNLKYRIPSMSDIEKFELRAGLYYGRISGDDSKNSDPELKQRNLNFKSHIIEFNLGCEYTILDMNSDEGSFISPYVFAGVGVFHFNPYTKDSRGEKYFLRPLCTEGQGLAEYPLRKKYKLTQFEIPIAVGAKIDLGAYIGSLDGWIFSYEFMYHHTFTDYLDDVSLNYVPLELLTAAYGPKSAELSFRENNNPAFFNRYRKEEKRGNPNNRDLFFYNSFKMTKLLEWRTISLRGLFSSY